MNVFLLFVQPLAQISEQRYKRKIEYFVPTTFGYLSPSCVYIPQFSLRMYDPW